MFGFIVVILTLDSDGAAALVLVSGEKALTLGLKVIAKIRGYADAAQVWWNEFVVVNLDFKFMILRIFWTGT